ARPGHPRRLAGRARRDALGRQPAEGRARQVARRVSEAADARRTDARSRRRREGGDLPAAHRRRAARDRGADLVVGDAGAADALRPHRRHVPRARRRVALEGGGDRGADRAPRGRARVTVWSTISRYGTVLILLVAIFVYFSVSQSHFFTS